MTSTSGDRYYLIWSGTGVLKHCKFVNYFVVLRSFRKQWPEQHSAVGGRYRSWFDFNTLIIGT